LLLKKEGQRNLVYNYMNKKIKNFELVTLALYSCGGYTKFIGTEDVAIQSDKMDNQRFRWKKYKEFIDRGLIFDCLNSARTRKLGAYVKGNDERGWILTASGLSFCETAKDFNLNSFKKKRISKIEKSYILREELRIKSTEAYDKFCQNKKDQILKEDIKNLYKIDDYTTKEDLEIRTINLLENFKDNDAIFKLIDTFKKKAMEVVK